MKKICFCGILFALCISTPALATPVLTLQNLLDGSSLTVGDKVFDNWSLFLNKYGEDGFDLSEIYVTGDNTDPLNPGIIYNTSNAISVSGNNLDTQLSFSFDVKTASGLALIKDNSLEITNYSFDGYGYIVIQEAVSASGGSEPFTLKTVMADTDENTTDPLFDYREFDPLNFLTIGTDVYLGLNQCPPPT